MELRERCIEAALQLLSEKGLHFTMSDLAKALGISKKTVYTVFESKEALFFAAADTCFAAIKEEEKKILESQELPLIQRLERLIIVLPEQYKNLNWYLVEELSLKYPAVYKYMQERMESDWEPTLQLLREGQEKGILKAFSLPVFKSMVEGCMEHFLTSPELSRHKISYTEALEEMIAILIRGIIKSSGVMSSEK